MDELIRWALDAAGTPEAEVRVLETESCLLRFVDSQALEHVSERDRQFTVRVALADGRTGLARCNQMDRETVGRAVRAARSGAELMPPSPDWPGLPRPVPAGRPWPCAFSPATAAAMPGDNAVRLAQAFRAAGAGGTVSGYLLTARERETVANSYGVWLQQERTWADCRVTVTRRGRTGYAAMAHTAVDALDLTALVAEAAERATPALPVAEIPPSRYPVVLAPYAVARLVEFLVYHGFRARPDRTANPVLAATFHPSLRLWDDGHDPVGLPRAFDGEGVPKQRVELIAAGRPVAQVHDRRTARIHGVESTGHALPAGSAESPLCQNLFLGTGPRPVSELIGSLARGILVTRFHYVNLVDERTLTLTGVTRDGTFLIEDGRVTARVPDMRFNQSLLDALAGAVEPAAEARLIRSDFLPCALYVPSLLVGSWQFTT